MSLLHVFRVRKQGEALFFDPNTDIRVLVPAVAEIVFQRMEDAYENTDNYKAVLTLHNMFEVLHIRIMEDKAPMDDTIREFFEAIVTVPESVRNEWMRLTVDALMCIYALFCRRDAPSDRDALRAILEYAKLSTYKELLTESEYDDLRSKLKSSVSLLVQSNTKEGIAVCPETGETWDWLTATACRFIGKSRTAKWNDLAEECDRIFNESQPEDAGTAVPLALAFPTFKNPNLSLDIEEEDGDQAKDRGAEDA